MEKLNIFYQLLKKLYNAYIRDNDSIKLEKQCGEGSQKIKIKNHCIVLTIGDKCKYIFTPTNIEEILYNIDLEDDKYYFQVVERAKGVDNHIRFSLKYDIKYKADDINQFIQDIRDLGILLSPSVGQYDKSNAKGLIKYCQSKDKFLLTILVNNNKLYFCHGIYYRDKNIEIIPFNLLDLEKEFDSYQVNSHEKILSNEIIDIGIYLLDKKVTMGLGYLIIPFFRVGIHDTFVIDSRYRYFCSSNIDKVKDKIKEYFEKKSSFSFHSS